MLVDASMDICVYIYIYLRVSRDKRKFKPCQLMYNRASINYIKYQELGYTSNNTTDQKEVLQS